MKKIFPIIIILSIFAVLSITAKADPRTPYITGVIEGVISAKNSEEIEIEEADGTKHIFTLSRDPAVVLSVDGIGASYESFKVGMDVYAELVGKHIWRESYSEPDPEDRTLNFSNVISYLESYSTEVMGYIPPGTKIRTGTVKFIDRDQIVLKTADGKEETFYLSPAVLALKNGNNVPISVLYEGDYVKVCMDEAETDFVSRIIITPTSAIEINDLYRGIIQNYDKLSNNISLDKLEVFRNGIWEPVSEFHVFSYNQKSAPYIGGVKIPVSNIHYYKGKTAYIVTKSAVKNDVVEKMVIKSQYETNFSDKILNVNWYSDVFELSTRKNFTFNDGTIIIKNGRLVDKESIVPLSDVFLAADGRNSELSANIIYVYNEEINNSNIGQSYIYELKLGEIHLNKILTSNFNIFNNNEWESFSSEKELYFNDDTYFYDVANKKEISKDTFIASNYAVDKTSEYADDNDLYSWYAYAYTDGDIVTHMFLQKTRDSLLTQRATTGQILNIEENENVGMRIGLSSVLDFSVTRQRWTQRADNLTSIVENAMIIKEGKAIKAEDLEIGDRLYIVRDGSRSKVIIVK